MSQSSHFMKLKQINIDLVKDALKSEGVSTKISISNETGLSVATCGNILAELLLSGEVIEIEADISTGGRPARRFVYNENHASVAAIFFRKEAEVEMMHCVVSNLLGHTIYSHTVEGECLTIDTIEETIDRVISAHANLKVLALGIPGVIYKGQVGDSNLESLAHLDLEALEERIVDKFGILVVSENDQNCIASGYYYGKMHDQKDSMAFLYYPKDRAWGSGIILNGKLIQGSSNFAGEVSYLPLGVRISDQKTIQKNIQFFSEYVCKVIASINAVINPNCIVLSGYSFKEPLISMITEALPNWIPEKHIPELRFEGDIHDYYKTGLIHIALEQLKCRIEIVER